MFDRIFPGIRRQFSVWLWTFETTLNRNDQRTVHYNNIVSSFESGETLHSDGKKLANLEGDRWRCEEWDSIWG